MLAAKKAAARPVTAYIAFANAKRPEIKAQNPDKTMAQVRWGVGRQVQCIVGTDVRVAGWAAGAGLGQGKQSANCRVVCGHRVAGFAPVA